MKVEYKGTVKTLNRRIGDFVHYTKKKGRKTFIRRFVKPKTGEHNHNFGAVTKNSAIIWKQCSAGFRNDLKRYAEYRSGYYSAEEIPAMTNFANFNRLLYRFRVKHPATDLTTITKEELIAAGMPTNLKEIIGQGYLPPVAEADELTAEMW